MEKQIEDEPDDTNELISNMAEDFKDNYGGIITLVSMNSDDMLYAYEAVYKLSTTF